MVAASPGVALQSIGDYVNHGLPHYVDRRQFETAMSLQRYTMLREFFEESGRTAMHGNNIEWRAVYKKSGAARYIRPFQTTPDNYINVFTKGQASWRHVETKALYNELIARDLGGPDELVNYKNGEMFVGLEAAADLLENAPWEVPDDASDDEHALGIPYWLPMLPSGTIDPDGDFQVTNTIFSDDSDANSSSTVGGIDRSAEKFAQSWAATVPAVVDGTYINTLRRAMEYTDFVEPSTVQEFVKNQGQPGELVYHTGIDGKLQYEQLVNAGPDDRNGDLNPFHGQGVTFRGMRWKSIPSLNGRTYTPGYAIRRQFIFPMRRSDMWGIRSAPKQLDDRFTYRIAWDWRFNIVCINPRKAGFVLHQAR